MIKNGIKGCSIDVLTVTSAFPYGQNTQKKQQTGRGGENKKNRVIFPDPKRRRCPERKPIGTGGGGGGQPAGLVCELACQSEGKKSREIKLRT